MIDRFRGRVIFPFYNLSGKVIGFGGRTLKNDKKEAKYLNSPETLLYKKSETLYGLFQAKKAIQKNENCYLVEGYTDVIGLHQVGIENVAASSGTSLTQEQARLIHRFSKKVTVIYDGDYAGIKASLRGINILLENDLQVAVVPLPEGEDPDSYSRKLGASDFKSYLDAQTTDFVRFKVDLLLKDAAGDPIKKSEAIHDLAETVSFISDPITRATYSSSTADMLGLAEQLFIQAVNQHQFARQKRGNAAYREQPESLPLSAPIAAPQAPVLNDEPQEADIIRILLQYGDSALSEEQGVLEFVVEMLDEIAWDGAVYEKMFRIFEKAWKEEQLFPDRNLLFNHDDKDMAQTALHLYAHEYQLSVNWEVRHEILTPTKEVKLQAEVTSAVTRLNLKKVVGMLRACENKMKVADLTVEEQEVLLTEYMGLKEIHRSLADALGTSISH